MTTFISLLSFTDQGIRNIKESPKRADAVKALAKKKGSDHQGGLLDAGPLRPGCRSGGRR